MAVLCFKSHSKHQAIFALVSFSFIIAVTDGCTYDFDCDIEMNQVCCNSECVYGSSCIGRYCTSDANCSLDESCCKNECTSDDCLGSSCSNDTDCEFFERCCYGTCKYANEECYEPLSSGQLAAVILCSIIGSLFSICLIAACICGRSGGDKRTQRRITSRLIPTPATVTTTRRVAQTNPPLRVTKSIYTRCVVQRSYQQANTYHPAAQQRTNRRPKMDNTLAASGQPPPYTAAPKGISGGVYAPQPSYGAVQSVQVSSDSHKNAVVFSPTNQLKTGAGMGIGLCLTLG